MRNMRMTVLLSSRRGRTPARDPLPCEEASIGYMERDRMNGANTDGEQMASRIEAIALDTFLTPRLHQRLAHQEQQIQHEGQQQTRRRPIMRLRPDSARTIGIIRDSSTGSNGMREEKKV